MTGLLLDSWQYFQNTFYWLIPVSLAIVFVCQLIYFGYLNARVQPRRRRRRRKLPDSPVMPTDPENSINVNYAARGREAAELNVQSNIFRSKMVVLGGLPNVSEINLPSNDFGVGRFYNPDQNIMVALDERSVSRRHAVFHGFPDRNEFYIMDTESSYGTSIRRGELFEQLTPGQEERIYNGDVVQFGSAVTVRFVLPGDTRAYATQV
ncbi:MAG: FHA domain-containing protein [Chloroflexota bacterium]